jgi:hypothetical protein
LKSQATITKLSDLGVSKQQAHLWQRIATIPETDFERLIGVAVGKAEAGIEAASKRKRQSINGHFSPFATAMADSKATHYGNKIVQLSAKSLRALSREERVSLIAMLRLNIDELACDCIRRGWRGWTPRQVQRYQAARRQPWESVAVAETGSS